MRGTRNRGQGATEYVLAVFFIAIACILAVGLFGDRVREIFGLSTEALYGKGPKSTPGGGGTRDSASTPGGGMPPESSPMPPPKGSQK